MGYAVTTAQDQSFSLVQGLEFSQNSGNVQYVDITPGKATVDALGVRYPVTSAAFTKRLNAAWAIGTNAGGLLTGTSFPASTTLHCYVMRRRTDGTVDHGFHTSAAQSTFTDGSSNIWDLQLHMSLITDATQVVPIDHIGNEVTFRTPFADVSAGIPITATLYTLSVPTGISVRAKLDVFWGRQSATGNLFFWLSDPASPDVTITTSVFNGYSSAFATTPAGFTTATVPYTVRTNTSSQVRCKANAIGGVNTQFLTRGYFHPRGGNPTVAQTNVLSGAVLQANSLYFTTQLSTTSTTLVDSGFSINLPNPLRNSSSKVRLRAVVQTGQNTANSFTIFTFYRNGTTDINGLTTSIGMGASVCASTQSPITVPVEFVDTPDTLTPVYNMYWRASANNAYINRRGSSNSALPFTTFTLEEIAG